MDELAECVFPETNGHLQIQSLACCRYLVKAHLQRIDGFSHDLIWHYKHVLSAVAVEYVDIVQSFQVYWASFFENEALYSYFGTKVPQDTWNGELNQHLMILD